MLQIRVLWCGICGTDIEEWRNGPVFIPVDHPHALTGAQAPLTLGHEVTGEVIDVGSDVTDLSVGDRVAVDGLSACGSCDWCTRHRPVLCSQLSAVGLMADGGLAERANVPARGCVRIPDSLGADEAALGETLAVGVRALRRSRLQAHERVGVIGAGAVGLLAAQAALTFQPAELVVVDQLTERRDLAERLGAHRSLPQSDSTTEAAFDVVLECSGNSSAARDGLDMLRSGGRLVLVGLYDSDVTLDALDVVTREKEVLGSLSHIYDEDFSVAIDLLATNAVEAAEIISDRVKLHDAVRAFRRLADNPRDHVKILVTPGEALS